MKPQLVPVVRVSSVFACECICGETNYIGSAHVKFTCRKCGILSTVDWPAATANEMGRLVDKALSFADFAAKCIELRRDRIAA